MEGVLLGLMLLLVLVVIAQTALLVRKKRQQGRAAPPLSEVLPEGIVPRQRMLFYFYSEHCAHCRHVTPLIDELERQQEGVVRVNVRRQLAIARRFGVVGTPALIRVDNGTIAEVHVGVISQQRLQRFYFN